MKVLKDAGCEVPLDLCSHALFAQSKEPILLMDESGCLLQANAAGLSLLGVGADAACRLNLDQIFDAASSAELKESRRSGREVVGLPAEVVVAGRPTSVLVSLVEQRHDGVDYIWMTLRVMQIHDFFAGRMELALQVFDNASAGILVTDATTRVLAVNRAFTLITGFEEIEVVGNRPSMLSSGRHDATFYNALWRTLTASGRWQGEIWNRRRCGALYPQWLNIGAVYDVYGVVTHYIGLFSDISAIKASQEHLDHLAHHDALTDLPNRLLFGARLDQALARTKREGTRVAVLYVDLDKFKPINDAYGHSAGDDVLVEVARRLAQGLRGQDTVARLGGDEFALILEGIHDSSDARRVIGALRDSLSRPIVWKNTQLEIGVSIGVAFAPDDGADAQTLLRVADANMYAEKTLHHAADA